MSNLPADVEGTGVFGTEDEITELSELAERAHKTPAILFGGKIDLAGDARKRMFERVYEIALSHGLPEIQGEYGLSNQGEFVTMVGQ